MRHLRAILSDWRVAAILIAAVYLVSLSIGCAVTEVEYQILVDREFAVQAMPETALFHSGEKFRLRLTPRQDCHVYLLNHGTSGNYTILFPRGEINDGSNLVPTGEIMPIPDHGSYQFDHRTGFEEVILCVSREPYAPLEQLAQAGFRDTAAVDRLLVELEQADRHNSSLVKTLDKESTRVCLVANRPTAVLVSRITLQHQPMPSHEPAPLVTTRPSSTNVPTARPAVDILHHAGRTTDPQRNTPLSTRQPAVAGPVTAGPSHPQAMEQQRELTLLEALHRGLIEVNPSGNGLTSVQLRVQRRHKQPLRVVIPVGTYFVSTGNSQNMITTAPQSLGLDSPDSVQLQLSAACVNLHRRPPDAGSRFKVGQLENPTLQRLLEVIASRSVSPAAAQVAIWVVTDNVSRHELSRSFRVTHYVNGVSTGEGPAAGDDQIAEAKAALEEAGVDSSRIALFR